MTDNVKLSRYLARGVFKIGDKPKRRVDRIAFKSRCKQCGEHEEGGLCESALAGVLLKLLSSFSPEKKT